MGVTATNDFGCFKDSVTTGIIETYSTPIAAFVPNPQTIGMFEPVISFTNQSIGASSYIWDFGEYGSPTNTTTITNPTHFYNAVGVYNVYLVAINSNQCTDTVMHTVEITPEFGVYIPNAFTPDGNNKNDTFQPKGFGINEDKYKMDIFDRWGELIFTSNTFSKGWDGKVKGTDIIAKEGVYIYKLFITDMEGNKKNYVGHVTLIKQ